MGIQKKNVKQWHPRNAVQGVLQALSLYMLYLGASFLDPWGYFPEFVHAVVYALVFLGMAGLILRGLTTGDTGDVQSHIRSAVLLSLMALVFAILAGEDRERRLEIAVAPQAIFSTSDPIISVSILPPAYSGIEKSSAILSMKDDSRSGLNPIAEGSRLVVKVTNLKWPPSLVLGEQHIDFVRNKSGEFQAQALVGHALTWQLRQGSKTLGSWPIILRQDDDPVINAFSLKQSGDLISLWVNLQDDYLIERASLAVFRAGKVADERADKPEIYDFPVRDIKQFKDEVLLNLHASAFAGQEADLELRVWDQAGQRATASLQGVMLATKRFRNPDATALWEIRQQLLDHPEETKKLARRVMALGLVEDKSSSSVLYHMALRSAYWRLADPANDNDFASARDLLWNLALLREEGEYARLERDLIESLNSVSLVLQQKNSLNEVRAKLVELDRLFFQYTRSAITEKQEKFLEDIDTRELRKLYGKILTYMSEEHYDQAGLLVTFMKRGLAKRDGLMLSGKGYIRFMAVGHGQKILASLIEIQKQLLARSYQETVSLELVSADEMDTIARKKTGEMVQWVKAQKNMANSLRSLAKSLKGSGIEEDHLLERVEEMVDDVVISIEAGDMERAARLQTEILGVLNDLKDILDKMYDQNEGLELQSLRP